MAESKVYVLGSINADLAIASDRLPEKGETMVGYDFAESLGGKGCNQAVALAKLGVPTMLIGAVGSDHQGQQALQKLRAYEVHVDHVLTTDEANTGIAIILRIDQDNRIILDQGANAWITIEQVQKGLRTAVAQDFLLAQFEVPLNIVLGGLQQAKAQHLTTIVNPAPALKVGKEMMELIDIMVLNQVESETLTGIYPTTEIDAKRIATWFFERGIGLVVLTLGDGGSFAITADQFIFTPAFSVDVIDTTGAGDAFIGTMLYCLQVKQTLKDTLRYANAAGALACTRTGAQTALPTLQALQAFMQERK